MPKADQRRLALLRAAGRVEEANHVDDAAARLVGGTDIPAGHASGRLQTLPIAQIVPNPRQPRRHFEEAALEELASSIRAVGILQPLLVRQADGSGSAAAATAYEIVAGERRWRAAQRAGLERVPAVVQTLDDQAALEASVTENLQREDLTPVEEAQILLRMTTQLGYSVRKLAERLGKGKGYVEDRLRLARMPEDLQALVAARPDTLTHAREIESVEDEALRSTLIELAAAGTPLAEVRRRVQASREKIEADAEPEQRHAWQQPVTEPITGHPAAEEVSGRPDTRGSGAVPEDEQAREERLSLLEASRGFSGEPATGKPLSPPSQLPSQLYEAVTRLREAASTAAAYTELPKDPAERDALRRELQTTHTAVETLLRRLDEVAASPGDAKAI